jgi:hypothetical protein
MKPLKKHLVPALLGLLALSLPECGIAETPSFTSARPNVNAKSITTPVAWGASNNVLFMAVGGTKPAPYATIPDGAAVIGLGLGDPRKNVGLQLSLTSLDLSTLGRYAMSCHLHRRLGNADAIAVGINNIYLSPGGDGTTSVYTVYSKMLPGAAQFHFSIGAGNGRYAEKSPDDIMTGKGAHGTYVFGNVACKVADSFNVIADWNGLNLNAGVSKTFRIVNIPIALVIGAADLTKNSGSGTRLVFAVGTAFKLF